MKVTAKYNQIRRDCSIDMECEGCGTSESYDMAYDDRNFWDNVVPGFVCKSCGESSKSLGFEVIAVPTKYPDYLVI